MRIFKILPLILGVGLGLAGCDNSSSDSAAVDAAPDTAATSPAASPAATHPDAAAHPDPAAVDAERYASASEPGQWLGYGRTWKEQRFSPLDQINEDTVSRLGLAWYADLNTFRGVEATPLVIDGVLYNISAFNVTTAYDAVSGKVLWTYDPKIPLEWVGLTCCGPVSRGLAAYEGKIIIATLDGRLIALDAKTGKPVWETNTLVEGQPLSITGAPRMAGDLVVIGNSGGDLGARGYISAYHADTGEKAWKFYIVPGKPGVKDGEASDSVMDMAAKTWTGEWWKTGGGGNDWDGIAYDPELNLVYFGTGNGSPHQMKFRSPEGGDNLFLCSVVAVDATTGEYRWHYQEIPSEEWDYDCTSPLLMAELTIDGQARKVIMHAPKNGFFYVMDRETGELISAEHYVPNNTWASHVDMKTGRPVVYPDAYPTEKPHLLSPGFGGGHNWNPISYSPETGLVYIPAQETYMVESVADEFEFKLGRSTYASGHKYPELAKKLSKEMQEREKGYLLAWDPVKQQEAWRVPYPHAGSGGTMVTAGNLVIQGTIKKTLAIYAADSGKTLWEMPVESVPVGGAATFMVDGKQYIATNAGWNSAIVYGLNEGGKPFTFAPARLLVFTLDAKGVTLPPAPEPGELPPPPKTRVDAQQAEKGAVLFAQHCQTCHGPNAVGGKKDLRYMTPEVHADFLNIVRGGERAEQGMPDLSAQVSEPEAEDIHAYLIQRAQEDWQPQFTSQ